MHVMPAQFFFVFRGAEKALGFLLSQNCWHADEGNKALFASCRKPHAFLPQSCATHCSLLSRKSGRDSAHERCAVATAKLPGADVGGRRAGQGKLITGWVRRGMGARQGSIPSVH